MGYCCSNRCLNAPHAWQVGWAQHVLVNGTNLAPGNTVSITIAAQGTANRTGVRIHPTWTSLDPLTLSFRIRNPSTGDVSLPDEVNARVQIHTSAIMNSWDSQPTLWRTSLGGAPARVCVCMCQGGERGRCEGGGCMDGLVLGCVRPVDLAVCHPAGR